MKNNLKQVKTMIKVAAIALLLVSSVACEKDKEDGVLTIAFRPDSDQGNNLKLTYPDGKIEDIAGKSILGWGQGNLLGGNYFKEVKSGGGGTDKYFGIRINIPKGTKKDEIIGVDLVLAGGKRLFLQNTADINLYPELWIDGSGFDVYKNATGKIKIVETDSYDIIGEVMNAEVYDINGKTVKISGFFWKKKAEPYSN